MIFFHKIQSYYIALNHFHLNMCKSQSLQIKQNAQKHQNA